MATKSCDDTRDNAIKEGTIDMTKYRLRGKCAVYQHCHIKYPESIELPMLTRCSSRDACAGHWITRDVDEIVEAYSEEDAIDNSLSQYEYDELEPTWCDGNPIVGRGA
jgi:hypothetical protein